MPDDDDVGDAACALNAGLSALPHSRHWRRTLAMQLIGRRQGGKSPGHLGVGDRNVQMDRGRITAVTAEMRESVHVQHNCCVCLHERIPYLPPLALRLELPAAIFLPTAAITGRDGRSGLQLLLLGQRADHYVVPESSASKRPAGARQLASWKVEHGQDAMRILL